MVMPYKNSSQIVLGDRSSDYKRSFHTTNKAFYPRHNTEEMTTNEGILARKTGWSHFRAAQ